MPVDYAGKNLIPPESLSPRHSMSAFARYNGF